MANPIIYTVTMPSGNVYDLADQYARDLIKELLNFHEWLGITTSEIDDGSTTNPVIINGESVTAVAGDVVSRDSDHKDFVLSSTGVWQNFGELTGLGALAFKDNASGSYTPAGSISGSFSGSELTSTGTFTPEGSVSGSFSGSELTSTGTFTPAGSVSASFTGSSTTSTGTFTPQGSVSSTGGTKTIKQFKSQGTLASCTMPTFTVSNGNLTITDGSYTDGTLPTGEDVSVGDGSVSSSFTGTEGSVSVAGTPSGSIEASFTGTEGNLSVAGTPAGTVSASFTGTEGNVSVAGTPSGTVSASFTGTEGNVSVAGTPAGSVSATFSGTAATITVS